MILKPDFMEKRILYIGNSSLFPNQLKFKNSNICLYRNGKLCEQVSCYLVNCVFVVGEHTITTQLLRQLQKFGIAIFFLSQSFDIYSSVLNREGGNYLLRQKQYRLESTTELQLAKNLVKNKMNNQKKLLEKYRNSDSKLYSDSQYQKCSNLQVLLGIEGNASKNYFQSLFAQHNWYRRAPQAKEDIINVLLDLGYTFLFNYVDALLQLYGFDTYKGFYHQLFFQRKSLSCDVMEPMRPLIDNAIIKAFHLKRIKNEDFKFENQVFSFKDYQVAQKYVNIFAQTIMSAKGEIYDFILNFYRHFLNESKYPWKDFSLC